jgi:hypothetical protein
MNEPLVSLANLLSDVILPNLQAVQASQTEQIAANNRLEAAIAELHAQIESQFAHLVAQLTACRAELAATQALLKATQAGNGTVVMDRSTLIH